MADVSNGLTYVDDVVAEIIADCFLHQKKLLAFQCWLDSGPLDQAGKLREDADHYLLVNVRAELADAKLDETANKVDLLLNMLCVKPADAAVSLPAEQSKRSPQEDSPKKRTPTANDLMKAELASNLNEVQGFTAQQWADKIGKVKSTVTATGTWKSLSAIRERVKAEKKSDRRRR